MEYICGNCRLFNPATSTCAVRIMNAGITYRDIPVDEDDFCLWEELGVADQIQEVRFWVEDPKTGQKINGDGRLKIQYPEGFFGDPLTNVDWSGMPGKTPGVRIVNKPEIL